MLSIEERRAKWIGLFADQQSSGLTVTAWCREHGIEKNTFYGWRKRLHGTSSEDAGSFVRLAVCTEPAAEVGSEPAACGLRLSVGGTVVLIEAGFDRRLLSDVLDVLESRGC
jgi:hypothetical protein